MSELPPNSPNQVPYQPQPVAAMVDQDQSNLNVLSIFYFIVAALQALGGCIFLLYVVLGLIFGIAGMAGADRPEDAGAAAGIGGFFVCLGLGLLLFVWFFALLNYKAGRGLRARKSLTLIYIMAVLHCLAFPLGTILGVFTFVVLSRPSVKGTFR